MPAKQLFLKVMPASRIFIIGLAVILLIVATNGFIWLQTDEVIAPAGLRALDWLWRVFICRCAG